MTGDGLASHSGEVEILLATSCYRNWDKLQQPALALRLHTSPLSPQQKKALTYILLLDISYLSLIDDGLHKGAQSHCLNSLLPVWKNMHLINICTKNPGIPQLHCTIESGNDSFMNPILVFSILVFPHKYLFVFIVFLPSSHSLWFIFQRSHFLFTICHRLHC